MYEFSIIHISGSEGFNSYWFLTKIEKTNCPFNTFCDKCTFHNLNHNCFRITKEPDFQRLNTKSALLQGFLNLIQNFSAGKDVSVSLPCEPSITNVLEYFQCTNRSVSYTVHHVVTNVTLLATQNLL